MASAAGLDLSSLYGMSVSSRDGHSLGKITDVYDDGRGMAFARIKHGLLSGHSLVPLNDVEQTNDGLVVGYDQQLVKSAPDVRDGDEVTPAEEETLFEHYGVTGVRGTSGAMTDSTRGAAGHDTSGPNTDDAMTRSEQQLHVGTEQVETGRARLRKYVVTEHVTTTVPVSHEEVRVEREPITDANVGRALDGPEISEEEHEITLREERPVVAKETVPVERVRLSKEQVTEEREVGADLAKEQIDTEGVYPDADRTGTRAQESIERR